MKVALIVYSQTGHTKSVAEKIRSALITEGHVADYIPVTHQPKENNDNPMEKVVFSDMPDLSDYDFFVFGSYVEAFNLCRVFQQYLKQLDSANKKAACLTTQQFMKSWLGGNAAQKKMKKLLSEKGYDVVGGGHVNWKDEEGRDERIEKAAEKIVSLIK